MRVIGVTGGVGAGKSTVLGILEEEFQAYVIQADQLGHILMEPGEECYDAVIALFGKEIIKKDKTIDRRRISDVVFTDKDMLLKLNGIIHPAVKQRILDLLGEQKDEIKDVGGFVGGELSGEQRRNENTGLSNGLSGIL